MSKRILSSATLFLLPFLLLSPLIAGANAPLAPVDPAIWQALEQQGQADVLVVLKEQADLHGALALKTKEEKGWYVYRQLTAVAERTQPPLRAYLGQRGVEYRSYWIRNMIRVQTDDTALIRTLAGRPEVARVEILYPDEIEPVRDLAASPQDAARSKVENQFLALIPDAAHNLAAQQDYAQQNLAAESPDSAQLKDAARPLAIGWNLQRVHADDVWYTLGITGTGAVIGLIDTGVQGDHPALINAYRPWIPGAPTRHDYNWYNGPGGSHVPVDYADHGTAMAGLLVGDDGGAHQTGIAPGAYWIACPIYGGTNGMDCLQFMLAPTQLDGSNPRPDLAPHVISNSWRMRVNYDDIIHTLYLAGIMFVKAAENEGPDCGTVIPPGHLPEVTAVGAFQEGDILTSYSSRGPMLYNGQPIIKPNLTAPGNNCPTTTILSGYGTSRGTSSACPHVAGTVALLISARPDLAGRIDTLQMILQETAEPKINLACPPNDPSGVPNNVWGYGILNAYDAVLLAQSLGMGDIEGQVVDADTAQPIPSGEIGLEDSTGRQLLGPEVFNGSYSHTLPAATYTLTASTYGYYPEVVGGVTVITGLLTIQNLRLTARPSYVISGTVTATDTGTPLSATVTALYTPLPPVQSDPTTGFYSLTLAEGSYTLRVESFQRLSAERPVTADQNQTQNLALAPIPYIPYPNNPVLEVGPLGTWDGNSISAPSAVFVDGTYYLFYMGSGGGYVSAIGYATSSDGVNFTKYAGNPILAGDGSGFDAMYVGYPAILVEDGTWILYYIGWDMLGQFRVGRATAPEPSGPWTRISNALLAPGSFWEWDGEVIYLDSVVRTDSGYALYYTGDSPPAVRFYIGMAASPGGFVWTKYNDPSTPSAPFAESDPVLHPGLPDAWDYRWIMRSSVRQTADGWEMFYGGYDPLLLSAAIGHATSPDGIHWVKDGSNPILSAKDDPMAAAYLANPAVVQGGAGDWLYYDGKDTYEDSWTRIGVAMSTTYQPAIVVEPPALEATLYPTEQLTQTLWISNVGGLTLSFSLHELSRTVGLALAPALGDSRDDPQGHTRPYVNPRVDPAVWSEVQAQGQAEAIIYLHELADLSAAETIRDWEARGRFVYEELVETAARSGGELYAWLEETGAGPRRLLAAYAIVATVDAATLETVASRPEVVGVGPNSAVSIPPLTAQEQAAAADAVQNLAALRQDSAKPKFERALLTQTWAVEWNIARIRADEVWSVFGITGEGVTVGETTTGVMYTHPALDAQYRGNLGGGSYDHNYNWFDLVNGQPAPYDDYGHGTLVTGIAVGDDGGANQIGVAPGARWIAFKACTSNCTLADLHAALDWMLAPTDLGGNNPDPSKRPQVVLNAWGAESCSTEFQPDLQALRAANILPVFALGAGGPACGDIGSPSDLPEAVAVGATDANDNIWGFSGYGPSCWGEIKPEVAAPGVDIRSSYNDGGYVVSRGTTRSAPHVAGTAALILSADPSLDIAQVEAIITSTALCIDNLVCGGTPCPGGANNAYGWGRIDAFEAVSLALGSPPEPFDIPWLSEDPISGTVEPGAGLPIGVTFDAAGLAPGVYLGQLDVESNDPITPHVYVPVTLTAVLPCEPVTGTAFAWTPPNPQAGQVVTFTGTATGTLPITYSWKLDVGSWQEGAVVTHSYALPGDYAVVLTATNCTSATATAVHTITVLPEPCEPVQEVGFAWMPLTPTAGQIVTFTASATGTAPITYSWKLDVGSWKEGAVVTHSYTLPGDYAVVVTATNCLTATATVQHVVQVLEEPGEYYYVYLPLVSRAP